MNHQDFNLLMPPQITICLWIIHLFQSNYAYNTVRSYVFSLASEIKFRGGTSFFGGPNAWFIHSTLKHFLKTKTAATLVFRRPITLDMLPHIIKAVNMVDYTTRVMVTMVIVGVFGCFRIGEICGRTEGKVQSFIKNRDISMSEKGAKITLWGTKTDKDNKGVNKFIANLHGDPINPFNLIKSLQIARRVALKADDPFFAASDGKAISRDVLVKFIQKTMKSIFPDIPTKEWNGISLRKGGATSAMRAGINGETIQKLGNWKSSVYKTYIDHSDSDIWDAQNIMARQAFGPIQSPLPATH